MSDLGNFDGVAYAYETVQSTSAVGKPTASKLDSGTGNGTNSNFPARSAYVDVETVAIRYTLDGSTPTVISGTGNGHLAAISTGTVNNGFWIRGQHNVANFQFINDTGTGTSNVHITYFRG